MLSVCSRNSLDSHTTRDAPSSGFSSSFAAGADSVAAGWLAAGELSTGAALLLLLLPQAERTAVRASTWDTTSNLVFFMKLENPSLNFNGFVRPDPTCL